MTYDPNADWTAAVASRRHSPVYFLRIDGLTAKDYATAPVKSPTRTKTVLMDTPSGGGVSIDLIAGTRTVQELKIRLLDVDDEITLMVSTEATGAPLSTLINRKATLYGGYADLPEAKYAVLYRGRISDCRMSSDLTSWDLTLSDQLYALLSKKIMVNATDEVRDPVTDVVTAAKPVRITGNVVNLLYSILTGSFLTTGDFPLVTISLDGVGSSAPTGLGIDPADIDTDRFILERTYWHREDTVSVVFASPEDGRAFIEKEFCGVFQMQFVRTGGGKIGIKFIVPAITPDDVVAITEDHIVGFKSPPRRAYEMHLNKFTIRGDYSGDPAAQNGATGQYETEFDVESEDDAADQTATEEVVEYLCESRLISSLYDGETIALELAGRRRAMFLKTPVIVDPSVTFDRINTDEGDVVAVTHRQLPDILTGSRGVTSKLMTVLSINPDYHKGLLSVSLLDSSFRRYGLIANLSGPAYDTATTEDRNTFAYLSGADGLMSNGDQPYRML